MEPKTSVELECIREGRIAWVIFNRPEVRNAMTWGMYDELERLCDELEQDEGVDVVILRGSGGEAFIAGTDIKQFETFNSPTDAIDYEQRIDRVIERLETLQKPTIAMLEGFCVGGGAAIAMVCDFRYATPDLKFGIPIARTLGNCVSLNNMARIVDLVGGARAKEVLMLARLLKADESLSAGLITQVSQPESIEDEVRAVAAKLSSFAPLTLRACKEGIRRVQASRRPEPGMDKDLIELCYTSQDFHNAVDAFINKKPHSWLGK
ncbi:enoyl-CoA hydratase/isomerase family protein [Halomonas sp. McH1-25]|uniref:enoyl-CoA hydratase/isomerase family protein n=1 Tax=unclassified Halomonas TaxID=2609666 RepID=UPI001EF61E47|nr:MULTISPECIES: enoyl-CoA hydratase/isomerase family protein [unclassified Halomonas]MCG7601085.1 enoyl-CoA hydratase/isomerase family protein [Halomonas sp. McH1-25]MCP1342955.1 enoyl-CoA hydratase/isomerase family protein [Halomonas sp. FL8]MCP1360807.1 enoyl-CoA hydratase/isomerase family protein [Halomonas sp. BBD45]MCP1364103.1 enoyl-CoA hydratase/isomerase family protein [Halomonas sp. BBD48]